MHHKGTLYFIYVFIFFEMWFCSFRLLTVTVFCPAVIKGAAVYMITVWLLFRIEFRSRVKFALPSHDKTERLSQGVIARVVFAPHQMLMRHSLQTTRFGDFQFTWYQNEISYQNESNIRNENRNELVPEWLVRERTVVSVLCKHIQRQIWWWNELIQEWKSFQYHVNSP